MMRERLRAGFSLLFGLGCGLAAFAGTLIEQETGGFIGAWSGGEPVYCNELGSSSPDSNIAFYTLILLALPGAIRLVRFRWHFGLGEMLLWAVICILVIGAFGTSGCGSIAETMPLAPGLWFEAALAGFLLFAIGGLVLIFVCRPDLII